MSRIGPIGSSISRDRRTITHDSRAVSLVLYMQNQHALIAGETKSQPRPQRAGNTLVARGDERRWHIPWSVALLYTCVVFVHGTIDDDVQDGKRRRRNRVRRPVRLTVLQLREEGDAQADAEPLFCLKNLLRAAGGLQPAPKHV